MTHEFLKITSACSFALCKLTTPTAESPLPFCRHGGNTSVTTNSQRFGITSGTDFVMYSKANANHGLCDHAVLFNRSCFGAAHNSKVVGLIASQAMAPESDLITGQQDRPTTNPKNDRDTARMPESAAMRRAASWQKNMLQLKLMGCDAGRGETKSERVSLRPSTRRPTCLAAFALRAGSEKERPKKLGGISKQWEALRMSPDAMNHL